MPDLDPAIWNLATARKLRRSWTCKQHGYGQPAELQGCACPTRTHALERARPATSAARGVGSSRVVAHVEELLAAGMTRTDIAVAAGLDRTTVGRLLRPDVPQLPVFGRHRWDGDGALTAAIWPNHHSRQPILRSLTAYDH